MSHLGPLTQLNMARRARVVESKAPWDELRVVFKIKSQKPKSELAQLINSCMSWPTGWKMTLIVDNKYRTQDGVYTVYFRVDHPPQQQAGAFVRATLSLLC